MIWCRLQLAKVMKKGGNLLLLDEPTNDLDVDTLRALEDAIQDFAGKKQMLLPPFSLSLPLSLSTYIYIIILFFSLCFLPPWLLQVSPRFLTFSLFSFSFYFCVPIQVSSLDIFWGSSPSLGLVLELASIVGELIFSVTAVFLWQKFNLLVQSWTFNP